MSTRAEIELRPLSIDQGEGDGDDAPLPTPSTSDTAVGRCLRRRRRSCRRLGALALLLLCLTGAALLVARKAFHLSVPNLLRTIAGGSNGGSSIAAVCLSDQLTEDHRTTIHNLHLDRVAPSFVKEMSAGGNETIRTTGFLWDAEDAGTAKWRPQGVTTHCSPNGNRFVFVSWYGRKDEGYADRGGRISVVVINNTMADHSTPGFSYGHVLLVDNGFCTLPNIHVGGIEQFNGTLYVADSRKDQYAILEFDLAGLYEVPEEKRDSLLGHRYVLRESFSFASPPILPYDVDNGFLKPSFLSYDVDNDKFLAGTYARCGKKVGTHVDSEECFHQPKNRLVWFDKYEPWNASSANVVDSCWALSEMQGAASARVGNDTILWVSSSYGPLGGSHLHAINATSSFSGTCPDNDDVALGEVTTYKLAPGVEDLHIERSVEGDRYLWMATEFGTRMVFATRLGDVLPRSV